MLAAGKGIYLFLIFIPIPRFLFDCICPACTDKFPLKHDLKVDLAENNQVDTYRTITIFANDITNGGSVNDKVENIGCILYWLNFDSKPV